MSNANKLLLQRAVLERLTGRPLGRGALQTQDLIDALCALASVVLEEHPHPPVGAPKAEAPCPAQLTMSNARDTETSPFTAGQNQRAEAVACAVAALGQIRQHDDRVAAYEIVQVAEFITGHPHTIDAEFVGDAPEPEAGDASATEKATECQWPGCEDPAQGATFPLRYERFNAGTPVFWSRAHPGDRSVNVVASCGNHTGWELRAVREA